LVSFSFTLGLIEKLSLVGLSTSFFSLSFAASCRHIIIVVNC
jgi:hypothetical protein